MNFHGKDAISRPTRASGRTLLLLALLLGLAGIGWIDVTKNSLIGLNVSQDRFVPLLQLLCGIAAISHIVQWYSDFVSYRGWNVTGKMPGGSHRDGPSETKLRDLADQISVLPDGEKNITSLSERLEKVENQIDALRWSMKDFDLFAKFYIFGWHLALPLFSVYVAFFLNRHA